MKKLFILAISAVLVANVSAQEQKKECCKAKQLNKEQRVEMDIQRLTNELLLSDEQSEKFAATYREYASKLDELFKKNEPARKAEPGKELTDKELDKLAKQRFESFKALADLQAKYYDKFRKDLSARQVEKVMHMEQPFAERPCCKRGCEGKWDGREGARPDPRGHRSHDHQHRGHQPRPQAPQPTE